jgi:hypothetical protein
MIDPGLVSWLLVLAVLLMVSAKELADLFRNLKGGGGNPPDHPLPATGSIEKSRNRVKNPDKSSQPI